MEAPEKLYLSQIIYGTYQYQVPDPDDDTQVEYVRKDAIIKKVCKWIKENITNNPNANSVLVRNGCVTLGMLVEDCKNYIEGE